MIGVVVCNYNKKDYVVSCVESLLNQSFPDIKIFVVDNASTDGSVGALEEKFGDRIKIIVNPENIGGAGGFDTGIAACMEASYEYILLADNDTIYDKDAVGIMCRYMEEHNDVGMCGAEILQMKNPEYIQELGGRIDYEKNDLIPYYRGCHVNSTEIPETQECDFLAACALLVRREVIENVGMMDKSYFVYWDDIEWSRRCKDHGYRLVALRDAHVWHNWSANTFAKFNSFTDYYGRRNKVRFFLNYLPISELKSYIDGMLDGMFHVYYGYRVKGADAAADLVKIVLEDIIQQKWGKVPNDVLDIPTPTYPLETLLTSNLESEVTIINQYDQAKAEVIERLLHFLSPESKIRVGTINDGGVCLLPCSHAMHVKENVLPHIYVDPYMNCIQTDNDYKRYTEYSVEKESFVKAYSSRLLDVSVKTGKKIAICGFREKGRALFQRMNELGMNVAYIIERNYEALSQLEKELEIPIVGFDMSADYYNQADEIWLTGDLPEKIVRECLELANISVKVR